jgi:GT2 family glycosyltransferase
MSYSGQNISVVIVTYRRHDWLVKVLNGLVQQTEPPREVIVVDASPAEAQLTPAEIASFPAWLNYVPHAPSGNVSRQRNQALRHCQGEIVLFLDDDIEFDAHLLENYCAAFAETKADGISGLVLAPGKHPTQTAVNKRTPHIYYPGAANYQAVDEVVPSHVICTASFAALKKTIAAVHGFDEQIYGSCDDVDLGVRLVKQGFRVLHHNKPRIIHFQVLDSGARAPELGHVWGLTNWFYFQLKHYWEKQATYLFWLTLWDFCRPSSTWLSPKIVLQRARAIRQSYLEAQKRLAEGPVLWPGHNN